MDSKKIYILSTGRTGSTYLSLLLKEMVPALDIKHQEKGARLINIFANLPFDNSLYYGMMKQLFHRSRRGYPPKSTVDPLLSGAICKLITNDYLDGKVIHLVRNPIGFVESFMNWKSQSLRKVILHHAIPFWNPVPFFHDQNISFIEWMGMSKFEKFCWIWSYKNRQFATLNSGENYLLLKFEDITSREEEVRNDTLRKLLSFLGGVMKESYDLGNTKVNKSPQKQFPEYDDWSPSMKETLFKHCGAMAHELGYEIKPTESEH